MNAKEYFYRSKKDNQDFSKGFFVAGGGKSFDRQQLSTFLFARNVKLINFKRERERERRREKIADCGSSVKFFDYPDKKGTGTTNKLHTPPTNIIK